MGRPIQGKDQPRRGTREVGSLERIIIEALEPRTLFSGGHEALRAQLEAFSSAGPQWNLVLEPATSSSELHRPHALGLAAASQTATDSQQPSSPAAASITGSQVSSSPLFAIPAFGLFARFTQIARHDEAGNVRLIGMPALPAIEIFYLQESGAVSGPHEIGKVTAALTHRIGGDPRGDGTAGGPGQPAPPGWAWKQAYDPSGPVWVLVLAHRDVDQPGTSPSPDSNPSASGANSSPPPQLNPANATGPQGSSQVTPLAMTPAARGAETAVFQTSSPKPLVVQTTPTTAPPAPVTVPLGAEASPAPHPLGLLAAAMPNALRVPQAVAVVSSAVHTADAMVNVTAHAAQQATNLFTVAVPAQSLPATVAYSFIHLDAGGFNDAVTAFARELSSLSTPAPSPHSNARAWEITAAVLGLDAIFIAWWYRKSRREREEQFAERCNGSEPTPQPVW